jgi:hypothetical protein
MNIPSLLKRPIGAFTLLSFVFVSLTVLVTGVTVSCARRCLTAKR